MKPKTIAEHAKDYALKFMQENDMDSFVLIWGDILHLDAIAFRAKMRHCHPLERHKRVLDALGRSELWQKDICHVPHGRMGRGPSRWVRRFRLKQGSYEQ